MTAKLPKAAAVEEHLALHGCHLSQLTRNKDTYTARKGFFYRHGKTAEDLANVIQKAIPGAVIANTQEKWTAFKGGASVANSSHWRVDFKLPSDFIAQTQP